MIISGAGLPVTLPDIGGKAHPSQGRSHSVKAGAHRNPSLKSANVIFKILDEKNMITCLIWWLIEENLIAGGSHLGFTRGTAYRIFQVCIKTYGKKVERRF